MSEYLSFIGHISGRKITMVQEIILSKEEDYWPAWLMVWPNLLVNSSGFEDDSGNENYSWFDDDSENAQF